MSLDIDKIDTNIRHAMGIVDLLMDNIGHRVDSHQDSMEYALWSAKKHLEEAVNAISGDGEERMAEIFADLDDSAFEEDEDDDEESKEDPFK